MKLCLNRKYREKIAAIKEEISILKEITILQAQLRQLGLFQIKQKISLYIRIIELKKELARRS